MLVSVIVPTKDRPHLLGIALDSISGQTHRNLEIIVVDNGSGDESAARNKQLVQAQGERSRYLYLPKHDIRGCGPSESRNFGIGAAKGELVAFCDDDDYWCDSGHLEYAVRAFAADSTIDLLFANQEARSKGRVSRPIWIPSLVKRLSPEQLSSRSGIRIDRRDCLIDDHAHLNTCVYRRSLLVQIQGFWEEVQYLEDMDIFVRAVDSARSIVYRPQTVAVHNVPDRLRQDNASTRLNPLFKHVVEINVAVHLLQCCRSIEARRQAKRSAGYAYRHLAKSAAALGLHGAASTFAIYGLFWLPNLRWAAYTAFLWARLLFSRRLPARIELHIMVAATQVAGAARPKAIP